MVRLLPLRNRGRAGLPGRLLPGQSTLAGTLASFATQFVGFAARPVGAAIFGHYGDRIGRKAALIATLSLMGAATVLMGVLPGYATIGVWAPILLVVLRIVQGIGVGGEWGGSVLMSMEWGSSKRRGFMASLPQLGRADRAAAVHPRRPARLRDHDRATSSRPGAGASRS